MAFYRCNVCRISHAHALRSGRPWLNAVQHQKFLRLLKSANIIEEGGGEALLSLREFTTNAKYYLFSPLFTHSFDFYQQQLTCLGDTLIDDYLSTLLLDYSLHSGLVLTVNAARQWNAVFHNHLAMRLFAVGLHFTELAIPLTENFHADSPGETPNENATSRMLACLSQLEPHRRGPTARDLAGTSFMHGTMPCGHSSLGWKFSHFVGAVHQVFGADAATRLLHHVYDLNGTGNIMLRASSFLLRTLRLYPAESVAYSILAAQGLPVRYVGKSKILLSQDEGSPAGPHATSDRQRHAEDRGGAADRGAQEQHQSAPGLLPSQSIRISGFGRTGEQCDLSLLSGKGIPAEQPSLLDGPGAIDMVEEWTRRTAKALSRHPHGSHPVVKFDQKTGWLSSEAQRAAQRGPAFAASLDVAAHRCFADVYGEEAPENGKVIGRVKFKRPVRDPAFYDTQSDMRRGIPFDLEGASSTEEFLSLLQKPHRRLFEVSMLVGLPTAERVVGKVVGWRYSCVRDAVPKAFLSGVLNDFHRSQLHQHPS